MKETSMDAAIGRSLQIRGSRRGRSCPDENLMAAYLEGSLTAAEVGRLENHAADCGYCRQVIGILVAVEEEAPIGAAAPPRAGYAGMGLSRTRVLAMAAALAIVIAGAVLYRMSRQASLESGAVQIAEVWQAAPLNERLGDIKPAEPEVSVVRPREEKPAGKAEFFAGEKAPEAEGTATAAKKELRAGVAERDLPAGIETEAGEKTAAAPAGIAGQQGIVAGGAIGDARQKGRPEPAEQKLATLPAGGRGAAPARAVIAQAPADAVMAFRSLPDESPRDAIRTMLVSLKDKAGPDLAKTAGDRRFYRTAGYWVDDRCDPAVAITEMPEGSPELEEILRAVPGFADLRSSGTPVLVYWKEKNVLLR